jgi:hypothetical protein
LAEYWERKNFPQQKKKRSFSYIRECFSLFSIYAVCNIE